MIKAHRGWIRVASELGQGATFSFWLPQPGTGLKHQTIPIVELARDGMT